MERCGWIWETFKSGEDQDLIVDYMGEKAHKTWSVKKSRLSTSNNMLSYWSVRRRDVMSWVLALLTLVAFEYKIYWVNYQIHRSGTWWGGQAGFSHDLHRSYSWRNRFEFSHLGRGSWVKGGLGQNEHWGPLKGLRSIRDTKEFHAINVNGRKEEREVSDIKGCGSCYLGYSELWT